MLTANADVTLTSDASFFLRPLLSQLGQQQLLKPLPGHNVKGWRLLLPLLSRAGWGGYGEAQPKHDVRPGPQLLRAGCRGE